MSIIWRKLVIAVLTAQLSLGCCIVRSFSCDGVPCPTIPSVLSHDLGDGGTCQCDCSQQSHDPCHRGKCCAAAPLRLASSRHAGPVEMERFVLATSLISPVTGGLAVHSPEGAPFFATIRLHLAKHVLLI